MIDKGKKTYQVECIGDALHLCVSKNHTFGTDAFLLADFAAPRHKDRVWELGTGCGIVACLMADRFAPKEIVAVDIQEEAIDQLVETLQRSTIQTDITPFLADLRELPGLFPGTLVDVVVMNPPYFKEETGPQSQEEADKIARHETTCTIFEICASAAKLLRFGGRLCLSYKPERLVDVLVAMRQSGVEPKRLRFVQQNKDTSPWLVLVEGKRGAKPFLTVEEPFLMEVDNRPTKEAQTLYRGEVAGE